MSPETEIKLLNGRTAILASLLRSVSAAGGNVPSFTVEKMKRMTAMQLLDALGPNHIRFTVIKPE